MFPEDGAPLQGTTVVDLTQYEAGPTCTSLLAWLGARVIKVERPGIGDPGRVLWQDDPELDSTYFLLMNMNKESVTIDLKSDDGHERLLALVDEADMLVENFSLGVMERLELEYERLAERNPTLVYASIKGFGSSGPWREYKAFDQIAQATSSVTSLTGYPDRKPVVPGAVVGDTGAGILTALGIVAALLRRERNGEGEYVEVSQQDAAVFFARTYIAETLSTGEPVNRSGNDIDGIVPAGMYPCKGDGKNDYLVVHMAINDPDTWDRFFEIIGRNDRVGDDRYYDLEFRVEHEDEIDEWVSEWTSDRDKHTAMETLAEAGIPCGAVLDTEEVLENEQLRSREMVQVLDHPGRGEVRVIGCPISFEGIDIDLQPAPTLGSDDLHVE